MPLLFSLWVSIIAAREQNVIANLNDYSAQVHCYFVTATAGFNDLLPLICIFTKVNSLFFNLGGVGGVHLLDVV